MQTAENSSYWFARHSRSVIFLIVTLAILGGFLALAIPVSVFPATNFPRILVAVDNNHQLMLGLVNEQERDPKQIADVVIKITPAGVPVRVGDVTLVEPGIKPVYTLVNANGQPALLLSISRQPDSSTVQVAKEVHAEVDRIRKSLPGPVDPLQRRAGQNNGSLFSPSEDSRH